MPRDHDERAPVGAPAPAPGLARLVAALEAHAPPATSGAFVPSELPVVDRALRRIRREGLARGPVFCEWGSGLGGVCSAAALLDFDAYGIECDPQLVTAARALVADLRLDVTFALGSFLQEGDEDLASASLHTRQTYAPDAWRALGIEPAGCDVVFAYPWPGEEHVFDALFQRHMTPGALLLTYHEVARVLIQRRVQDGDELQPVGWV